MLGKLKKSIFVRALIRLGHWILLGQGGTLPGGGRGPRTDTVAFVVGAAAVSAVVVAVVAFARWLQ
ncbi:MAG: hypothetical protein U1F53_07190 [Burkholderiaceae bacterium]